MNERRYAVAHELRASGSGKAKTITGYACTWNNPTSIGDFDEVISPKPFRSLDTDSVVMNFQHDDSMLLGRSGVNLQLTQDEIGLRFSCTLNGSTISQDCFENISSGILSECSFAFTVCQPDGEVWSTQPNGRMLRTLKSLRLWDTAIVVTPAYAGTSAQISRNIVAEDIQLRMAGSSAANEDDIRRQQAASVLASIALEDAGEQLDLQRLRDRRSNLLY